MLVGLVPTRVPLFLTVIVGIGSGGAPTRKYRVSGLMGPENEGNGADGGATLSLNRPSNVSGVVLTPVVMSKLGGTRILSCVNPCELCKLAGVEFISAIL